LWLSDQLANGTNGFPYAKHWLTDTVLHVYAARLISLIGLSLIVFNFWQWLAPSFNRKTLTLLRYVMFSWLGSLLVISVLKRTTTLPCPWSIKQFGGGADYVFIQDLFSSAYPVAECFPAAHSSGGYGFLCLGFVALVLGRSMSKGFLFPTLVGLLLGGTQIVRGAHFISHDLFTAGISLCFAWVFAEVYLFRSKLFWPTFGQSKGTEIAPNGSVHTVGTATPSDDQ
jgi:membrane-associated PAP2 superfamily phosphatase